jgi:hypothetical protein
MLGAPSEVFVAINLIGRAFSAIHPPISAVREAFCVKRWGFGGIFEGLG